MAWETHAKGRAFAAGTDDWSFHAHARRIHRPASGARCDSRRGCADGAAVPAQSAVQQGVTARFIEESRTWATFTCRDFGGLRHAKHDSLNAGWRNASFRGYADYMQTPEFEQSLEELIHLANQERIALMCAEAVPWRCHRSLIADALLVRGIRTEDIMSPNSPPGSYAYALCQSPGTTITYPTVASQSTSKQSPRNAPGRSPFGET